MTNKVDCLFPGMGKQMKGPINTCHFVRKEQVLANWFKDVTYGTFECTEPSQRAEKRQARLVISGNHVNFTGEIGTPTAAMLLVKIMLSSVISAPGANFMTIDVSNFYLAKPMEQYEYVKLKLCNLPEAIIQESKITTPDNLVYIEVRKRYVRITTGRPAGK